MGRPSLLAAVVAAFTVSACCNIAPRPEERIRWDWPLEARTIETCAPAPTTLPILREGRSPKYPVRREILREEGYSKVQFEISVGGTAENIVDLGSSHPAFFAALREAMTDWRFTAAKQDGANIRVTCTFEQIFLLKRVSGSTVG